MAESLLSILEKLEAREGALRAEMESLRLRNKALEQENADLRKKEAEALRLRDEAMLDVEYLSVSHKLAENPDSIVETRRIIAGLIRNIDRCITMLKE